MVIMAAIITSQPASMMRMKITQVWVQTCQIELNARQISYQAKMCLTNWYLHIGASAASNSRPLMICPRIRLRRPLKK